jgi:hypothetical protein
MDRRLITRHGTGIEIGLSQARKNRPVSLDRTFRCRLYARRHKSRTGHRLTILRGTGIGTDQRLASTTQLITRMDL